MRRPGGLADAAETQAMSSIGSVTRLVQQLQSERPEEREEAARQIFGRYYLKMVRLAFPHLSSRIRVREDAEDVAHSAMGSVLLSLGQGAYEVASRDELCKLLARVTLNKVRSVARRHTAAKRDVNAELPPPSTDGDESRYSEALFSYMDASGPSEEEAAFLRDAVERLPPDLRKVARLILRGDSYTRIAKKLGCTTETIRLKRLRIRRAWEALLG
jgi:RNA polymerase sigma factor (sigma-70 family)